MLLLLVTSWPATLQIQRLWQNGTKTILRQRCYLYTTWPPGRYNNSRYIYLGRHSRPPISCSGHEFISLNVNSYYLKKLNRLRLWTRTKALCAASKAFVVRAKFPTASTTSTSSSVDFAVCSCKDNSLFAAC